MLKLFSNASHQKKNPAYTCALPDVYSIITFINEGKCFEIILRSMFQVFKLSEIHFD